MTTKRSLHALVCLVSTAAVLALWSVLATSSSDAMVTGDALESQRGKRISAPPATPAPVEQSMGPRLGALAQGDGAWNVQPDQGQSVLHSESDAIIEDWNAGISISGTATVTPRPVAAGISTPPSTGPPVPVFRPSPTIQPSRTGDAAPAATGTPAATQSSTSTCTPSATSTASPSQAETETSTATPTRLLSRTPTHTVTGTPAPVESLPAVVINEVCYDALGGWPEPQSEWFELRNNSSKEVDLGGWTVGDNVDRFVFPDDIVIPASGHLVLAYDAASFRANWGGVSLAYGRMAGNLRLANDGDRLVLRASTGDLVDGVSYGDDSSVLSPPCSGVAPGHSLEREPAGHDSDRATDFVERTDPSPGSAPSLIDTATPIAAPSPTLSSTATPTPTSLVTPLPSPAPESLLISEVCYDGTTSGTEGDEFVELLNPLGHSVALTGYRIGDEEAAGGGEGMYRLPEGESIAPAEVLVIAKNAAQFWARFQVWPDFEVKVSGADYEDSPSVPNLEPDRGWGTGSWALSNDGDEVLLLGPGDALVDAVVFRSGHGEAVGVSGTLSAPDPLSLQRVLGPDSNHMPADFAIDAPNPGRVTDIPLPPERPPAGPEIGGGMRAFWGCMHAHSTYSDGSGPPRYAYAVGRANGLHFLALTDHSHMVDAEEWADLSTQASAASESGAYIALRGFEWTSRAEGHVSVYNTATSVSRDDNSYDSLSDFYPWLAAQEDAVAQFNHPFAGDFAGLLYNQAVDHRMVLLEVGNGSGVDYRRFEEAYPQALGAGWHVGPANNGDTETPNWGADTPHRTGLVAHSLSTSDLLGALKARRTFATEDSNLALALRTGVSWMGEVLEPDDQLEFTVSYRDADGESAELTLYDRSQRVGSATLAGDGDWVTGASGSPGHYYWVMARQTDGDLAYSSPVWIPGAAEREQVLLNELCPAPLNIDWDDSGTAGPDDEWIELYNDEDVDVGLAGWQLDDEAEGGSAPYTFQLHQAIPAHGHLVVFKRDTGVALNDSGDSVRLLRPDGSVADDMAYPRSPGYDRTWCRTEDGAGEWTSKYEPTMGEANQYPKAVSPPEEESVGPISPERVTLAEARALPVNTLVVSEGQLTVPPGVLEGGTIYIQDAEAAMKVYYKDAAYSTLAGGDWVQVEGRLTDYHGEREITVAAAEKVHRLSSGPQLIPMEMATGELSEPWEGKLVAVAGRVTGWDWDVVYLNDGSGDLAVYFGRSLLVEKPWVERGELYLVVGVVSQYASARPYEGGYRILPRYERDVTTVPAELPATGIGLVS